MPSGFKIGQGVVEIIADRTGLRGQVQAAVREAGAGQHITVPVRTEMAGFTRDVKGRLHDARGRFVAEGRESGRLFGLSFSTSAGKSLQKAFAGVVKGLNFVPVPPAKITAIGAAIAALVPIVSGLVSSLGMATLSATALIPALFGIGGAAGIVISALKGVTERTDVVSVRFTKILKEWQEELKGLQKLTGDVFLPGMLSFLASAKTLLPDVRDYIFDLGGALRGAAVEAGNFVASDVFRSNLRVIVSNNAEAVRNLAGGFSAIGTAFMDIAAAAAPLLVRWSAAITLGSQNLAIMLEMKRESGELADIFRRAGDSMATWWNIITDLLVGIVNVFRAINPAGERMAGNLETIARKFREWTGSIEGQQRIRGFFEFLMNVDYQRILAIAAAVTTLTLALKGMAAVQGVAGAVSWLVGLGPIGLAVLAVAAAVAVMAGAFAYLYVQSSAVRGAVGDVWRSLQENLSPALSRLSSFVMENVVPALRDGFLYYLGIISDILTTTVFPALRDAADVVLPALEQAWASISKAFSDNKSEISTLVDLFKRLAKFLSANVIPVLAFIAKVLITQFGNGVSFAIRAVGFLVRAVKAIGSGIVAAKNGIVSAWGAVTSFFSSAVGKISGVISSIGSWFASVGQSIVDAFRTAVDFVLSVWNQVWGAIEPVVSFIIGVVQFGLNVVHQIFMVIFTWIYEIVISRITMVRDGISVILSLIFDIVSMVLGHIRDFFVTIWNAVSETVTTVFSAIWEVISSVLSTIWGYISAVMSTIFEGWSIAWGWIKDTVSGVWDVIWGKIVDITEKVQGTISRWFDKVKGVFSTALSSIRHLWDSAWKWVHEKIVTWGDRIAGIGTSIKDRIVSAIRSIPSGIISAINGMIDLVNSAIRTVNKIIPDKMDIPELGHVKLPKFAGGGLIRGPGTGTSDSIPLMTSMGPIMGSNGEFMIRARSTRGLMEDFGPGFLDWLNAYDVKRGDPSALAISPRRYAEGGLITRTQDWIRAQDPKPYVLGSNGPAAWDCSSLVGGVWALLTGRNPYQRYFTTYTLPGAGGFKPGHGLYTIGLSREHVVGNFAGLRFEAANPAAGVLVGSGATSVDAMPAQYHLPEMGEGFMGDSGGGFFSDMVAKAVDRAANAVRGRLPRPGGIADNIVSGVFERTVSGLREIELDTGGVLLPGRTLVANRTGARERVLNPEQTRRWESAGDGRVVYRFERGAITLDVSKIKNLEDLLKMIEEVTRTARQYGA